MKEEARWFFIHTIQGHLAMWAVRQCPYHRAPRLAEVLEDFEKFTRGMFDPSGMAKLDRQGMRDLIWLLRSSDGFNLWNVPWAKEARDQQHFFCSAHDGKRNPDYDIIDLDALVGNTVRSLFREADAEHERDNARDPWWKRLKYKWQIWRQSGLPCTPNETEGR